MAETRPGEDDPTRSMHGPPSAQTAPPLLKPGEVLEEWVKFTKPPTGRCKASTWR
jgi:hypothetical protein